jgi:hypothetical protein
MNFLRETIPFRELFGSLLVLDLVYCRTVLDGVKSFGRAFLSASSSFLVREPPVPDTHDWYLWGRYAGGLARKCNVCGRMCRDPKLLRSEDRDCATVIVRSVLES